MLKLDEEYAKIDVWVYEGLELLKDMELIEARKKAWLLKTNQFMYECRMNVLMLLDHNTSESAAVAYKLLGQIIETQKVIAKFEATIINK